jgi:hypothetical protein
MKHTECFSMRYPTRFTRVFVRRVAAAVVCIMLGFDVCAERATGAVHRSENFVVEADSAKVARQVAEAAEHLRLKLARQWLNVELPAWSSSCRIVFREEPKGGRGWTTYTLFNGRVDQLQIRLDGPLEHVIENVLPHEIAHTVLVTSMGRLIPRWADEGIALMAETSSVRLRQRLLAAQLSRHQEALTLRQILNLQEYPKDRPQMLAFYARSYTLAEFLVARENVSQLLQFLNDGERHGWDWAVKRNYGFDNVDSLEAAWQHWMNGDTFIAQTQVELSSTVDGE